jgi:uncharacterized protein
VRRVIVDTYVVVSALVFGGKPAAVLQLIEAAEIELVVSAELEAELVETLTDKFGWPAGRVRDACGRIFEKACRVDPAPLHGVVRDRDDDHVIAAAVEADADAIVTGDQDLLTLREFRRIRVVTPRGVSGAGPFTTKVIPRNARLVGFGDPWPVDGEHALDADAQNAIDW